MRIDHRCAHIFVTQQFLDRPDVITIFQQVGGKAMPKRMTASVLFNSYCAQPGFYHSLHVLFGNVMPPDFAGARVD